MKKGKTKREMEKQGRGKLSDEQEEKERNY